MVALRGVRVGVTASRGIAGLAFSFARAMGNAPAKAAAAKAAPATCTNYTSKDGKSWCVGLPGGRLSEGHAGRRARRAPHARVAGKGGKPVESSTGCSARAHNPPPTRFARMETDRKPLHTFKASQKQVDFYDGMDVSEPKANYYSKYSCKN